MPTNKGAKHPVDSKEEKCENGRMRKVNLFIEIKETISFNNWLACSKEVHE